MTNKVIPAYSQYRGEMCFMTGVEAGERAAGIVMFWAVGWRVLQTGM